MPTTRTLVELVLCAHFQAPLNITVLDVADWAAVFADEFPLPQQVPASPRTELVPYVQFGMSEAPIPRLILRSQSSQMLVQIQQDRFAIGWARKSIVGEEEEYPGYDVIRSEWIRLVKRFYNWHSTRIGGTPETRIVELAYINAAPLIYQEKTRRISEIFKFVSPTKRSVKSFNVNWAEFLEDNPEAARVTAQTGLGAGPAGIPVYAFNFVGLSPASGEAVASENLSRIDALHERIIDIYRSAIIS